MKDLDFDELDRAVSSLMANVPKTAPQTDEAKEKTLSIDSTLTDDAAPQFGKVEETAAQASDAPNSTATPPRDESSKPVVPAAHAAAVHTRPQPAATPAARRSGRFMDVVHPSADMTKPDAPKPVSRQGVTIEPLSSSAQKIADIMPAKKTSAPMAEEKSTEEPVAEDKSVVSSAGESSPQPNAETSPVSMPESPVKEEPTPSSDWPDPLDMMTSPADEKPKEETPAVSEEEPEAQEEPSAPLTSPFLPDTKVEKRPLGGFAPEEEPTVEEPSRSPVVPSDDTPKTIDDPNAQLPADPNAVETQLPEELSGDLMAVEADTTHDELKQAHESTAKNADVTDKKETAVSTPEPTSPSVSGEPAASAGPTSIPQQYREEPSTGDKDNGAIYDTDTYHQPIAHPAKKKSGWMWVVWIVIILLLGAGGGAALYFLGLV